MRFLAVLVLLTIAIAQVLAGPVPAFNELHKRLEVSQIPKGQSNSRYDTLYGQAVAERDVCIGVSISKLFFIFSTYHHQSSIDLIKIGVLYRQRQTEQQWLGVSSSSTTSGSESKFLE